MAYDPAHEVIVLFGGSSNGTTFDDTWTWDGENWTQQNPPTSPGALSAARLAANPATHNLLLVGGPNAALETWSWDGQTWTHLHPQTSPSIGTTWGMVTDRATGRIVLVTDGPQSMDTWTWDGSTWMKVPSATAPPRRLGVDLAYDAARRQVILFGGSSFSAAPLHDMWTWDGTTWTQRTPRCVPSGDFSNVVMAGDDAHGTVVLLRGDPEGFTWLWAGEAWTPVLPASRAGARPIGPMAYDAARGRVLSFGGTWSQYQGNTWTWDGSSWTCMLKSWCP